MLYMSVEADSIVDFSVKIGRVPYVIYIPCEPPGRASMNYRMLIDAHLRPGEYPAISR